MRMPKKLKNHILNYIRFLFVYFMMEFAIQGWQQTVGFDHYWLVEAGSIAVYIGTTYWFIWRGYVGLYRDGDFFDNDWP
jgi:hypothetical protein